MGFFRRYKLSDYTADACRTQIKKRAEYLAVVNTSPEEAEKLMEEWACFRELLARHEKQNQSPLDDSPESK